MRAIDSPTRKTLAHSIFCEQCRIQMYFLGRQYLQGNLDVVQWLVEHGADVNATDIDGNTPLNLAEERKDKKITEYLKKKIV